MSRALVYRRGRLVEMAAEMDGRRLRWSRVRRDVENNCGHARKFNFLIRTARAEL